MKKLLIVFAAIMLGSCEKPDFGQAMNEETEQTEPEAKPARKGRKFTFTLKGDFANATFNYGTRSYLYDNAEQMTDLWVFDYMGDSLVQSIHQEAATAGTAWGRPQMELAFGSHKVYFVTSRGAGAAVDSVGHTIDWQTVRDTYWQSYDVNVTTTSNGNRAVTLERVVTKLKVTATDNVPTGCYELLVTPSTWYYGIDYVTGAAVCPRHTDRVVSVPPTYIGTAGTLAVSIYGFSAASEWITDVEVTARNASSGVIGHVIIEAAPFLRNRSSEYSGALFGSAGQTTVVLSTDWLDAVSGTF